LRSAGLLLLAATPFISPSPPASPFILREGVGLFPGLLLL
jgi:hypothetical protein